MEYNENNNPIKELQLNCIKISFDTQKWQSENAKLNFGDLSQDEFLTECAYGNIEIFEDLSTNKIITLQNIELGYLLLELEFVMQEIMTQDNGYIGGKVTSMHQNFALHLMEGEDEETSEVVITNNYTQEREQQTHLQFATEMLMQEINICKKYYLQTVKECYPTLVLDID